MYEKAKLQHEMAYIQHELMNLLLERRFWRIGYILLGLFVLEYILNEDILNSKLMFCL